MNAWARSKCLNFVYKVSMDVSVQILRDLFELRSQEVNFFLSFQTFKNYHYKFKNNNCPGFDNNI